jgi:2-deoxy-D-gluconate 3-dehydrogenase
MEEKMILDKFSLKGKVAVVTGSNTGLGQGICRAYVEAGAKVVGVSRRPSTETEQMLGTENFYNVIADLSSCDVIPEVINKSVEKFGRIDILVNNAGIIKRQDSIEFSEENWDSVINVNLKTVFFLTQAVGKQFIVQHSGGKIINIASMLSFQGGIRVPSYTASKSAIRGITMTLANEWAKYGVNVNAIAPGYMATNNTQQLRQDEERSSDILARIPAGRWGTPEDIEGAAVYLASAASDYVNGFTLAVDGGWLAR